ncbi:DNA internalization-related competence protein ComEC/Rec2 [Aliamphritea hakodatensis]|uniref:DNA internalization-related competence protein ComEC/Rec2 n=1 Tax=Aliamphritea hakodatensis TaxID=2895352 RepID=UPI0022FD8284|nr:DNA internalization-related competence protein ComEC/Rec2 [Aliamphritea hakodatensis]
MIGFCIAVILSNYSFLPAAGGLWPVAALLSASFAFFRRFGFFSFSLGMAYVFFWGQWQLSHRLPLEASPYDGVVSGVVVGLPDDFSDRVRFELLLETPPAGADSLRKVRLTWYRHTQTISPGQRWRFSVRLKTPRSLVNPAGFDFAAWHLSRGIDARGYVRSDIAPERLTEDAKGVVWPDRQRYLLSKWLEGIGFSRQALSTLQALLLGDKRYLSDAQWLLLQDTGTVHLVVISGLHIGIACLLGYWLAALIQLPLVMARLQVADLRRSRIVVALLFATVYAFLAGFTVPTQRALIMAAAMLLPPVFGVVVSVWQRWWFAMMLVLLIQPLSPLQAGFWLSFFAVAVLLTVVTTGAGRGWWAVLQRMLFAQIAIFVGLLPILLIFTGNFSLISPLVNIVAIPFISFIVLPVMVMLIPLLALGVTGLPVTFAEEMLSWFWQGLAWADSLLNRSGLLTNAEAKLTANFTPEPEYLLLAVAGIGLLLLPRVFPFRVIGAVLCLPLFFGRGDAVGQGGFQAWVLDVGQGLAVLVKTSGHSLLFDTGASYPGGSLAQSFVVPSVQRSGVGKLNWLVVSHGDNDHSGGFMDVNRMLKPDRIFYGSAGWRARQGNVSGQIGACGEGQTWQADGVRFSFIQPESKFAVNENNTSCVLVIENNDCRLVLPGDAEALVEEQIIRKSDLLTTKYTWLVAGHHGSQTSTGDLWLDWLKPQQVIFSSGFKNRYGHPAEKVIARLERRSVPWLDTGLHGAVQLSAQHNTCGTVAARQVKWRYWLADSIRQ